MSDKIARARFLTKRRVQSFRNKKLRKSENSSSTESRINCDLPQCLEFHSDATINCSRFDELKNENQNNDNLFDYSFQRY